MPPANLPAHIGPGVQGRMALAPADLLPEILVADIFSKAKEQSVLMTLGQQIPISLGQTTVPVPSLHKPQAGQVGTGTSFEQREGHKKPLTGIDYGSRKSFMPIKVASVVTASREFALVNPERLWTSLSTELPAAIARALDLAVVHGKDALRGTDLLGIATNGFINETANRVTIKPGQPRIVNPTTGEVTQPDLYDQIIEGWRLVTDDTDYDVTHFAYDRSLVPEITTLRDPFGNPVWRPGANPAGGSDISLNTDTLGSIMGVPASRHRDIVTGKVGQAPKTNTRILAGDWSQLAYGYADQISFRVTDVGVVTDQNDEMIDLWTTNQIAVLCEATFGWLVNDPSAFVAFDVEAESS